MEGKVVKDVEEVDGVHVVQFDMCMLGLVSKVARKPIPKRTALRFYFRLHGGRAPHGSLPE